MNDTFNYTAGFISLIVTILIGAIVGFFIGRNDRDELMGTMFGALIGLALGLFIMPLCGSVFSYPPEIKTTIRYEVTVDDSVSLTEFYEHYIIVEQCGEIFVVEEKPYEG